LATYEDKACSEACFGTSSRGEPIVDNVDEVQEQKATADVKLDEKENEQAAVKEEKKEQAAEKEKVETAKLDEKVASSNEKKAVEDKKREESNKDKLKDA